jgi:uncharacterized membrane protein (UPF0127 family)
MKNNVKKNILSLALLLLSTVVFSNDELDRDFNKKSIIISSNIICAHFRVWLAENPKQQSRGLMHIRELPEHTGMLFIYSEEKMRAMWMKNTLIPLDMIFIRNGGVVSSIAHTTEPLSLKSIRSIEPVQYVLELNSGMAKNLNLDRNNKVLFLN